MLIRPALHEYRTAIMDSRYWRAYAPRNDDIIIASAPKCGTTWMQQIVSSLVFRDPEVRALPMVSPWVEARFRFTAEQMRGLLAAIPHRRFLKTHLPLDSLPLYDEVKYIHVARDGRDAAMSMHNHFSGFSKAHLALLDEIGRNDPAIAAPYQPPPPDPALYFRQWLVAGTSKRPAEGPRRPHFFDIEVSYWAERKRANLLLVHYADLSRDLGAEMRRIADFLEIEIDDALWPSIVQAARFESMRAAGDALMPFTKDMLVEGSKRFFNKGVDGRWQGVLTPDDLAQYARRAHERLGKNLAAWLEGGRNGAGEPRETPD